LLSATNWDEKLVGAYGNEDLGNRNVEDQDLAGRTGMVSCFGAGEAFSSRFVILEDAIQAQSF